MRGDRPGGLSPRVRRFILSRAGVRSAGSHALGVAMESPMLWVILTIAFLVLGLLALGFGADSREGFAENDDWRGRH